MTCQPGSKNPNWKGGRTLASSGYWLVKMHGHPLADCRGYVYEHRLVACQKLGRLLEPGEIVHHVNGDKQDNRPDNIEILASISSHRARHRSATSNLRKPGQRNPMVHCECGCGARFRRFDKSSRPRRFVSGHNLHPG